MKNYYLPKFLDVISNPLMKEILQDLILTSKKLNVPIYLVGGFVRDIFFKIESYDIDIETFYPELVVGILVNELKYKKIAYLQNTKFKTWVVIKKGFKVDIVLPRKEKYTMDSIKPIVSNGTLEDAILRRDFTMNALYYDLHSFNLIDYIGGKKDLENKYLRTTKDPFIIIKEDPIRMLRGVRFASKFKATFDPLFVKASNELKNHLNRVPKEQIHRELIKGAKYPNYFINMESLGLIDVIFPEMMQMRFLNQNQIGHTMNVFDHSLKSSRIIDTDSSIVRIAMLLHDYGKIYTTTIGGHAYEHENVGSEKIIPVLREMKFSNQEITQISEIIQKHMHFFHLINNIKKKPQLERTIRKSKLFFGDNLDLFYQISLADIKSDHPNPEPELRLLTKVYLDIKEYQYPIEFHMEINGHDLIDLGYIEGKQIGVILKDIKEKIINNELSDIKTDLISYTISNYLK